MSRIEDLVARARAEVADREVADVVVDEVVPPSGDGRLAALLVKQRERVEQQFREVPVMLAGELVTVRLGMLTGMAWCGLTGQFPPREGVMEDRTAGFDQSLLPGSFPVDRLLVDGESVSAGLWAEAFALMDTPDRETLSLALWGMQEFDPAAELFELQQAKEASHG